MIDAGKISVVVPVYNVEKYLQQCLESLSKQTYPNLEIICVDDGSQDHSGEILDEWAEKDSRIQAIHQTNQGALAARNTGIGKATGSYIMFLDSDDWVDLNTCEVAMQTMLKHRADLVFWSYRQEFASHSREKLLPWEDGKIFDHGQVQSILQRRQCGLLGEELAHPEHADTLATTWGKLYHLETLKKGFLEQAQIQYTGTSEDAIFNLYVLNNFSKAVYIKKCFNHYRKTNVTSFTRSYKPQLFEQWKYVFQIMRVYNHQHDKPLEFETALNNRIAMSLMSLGLNQLSSSMSVKEKYRQIRAILLDGEYHQAVSTLSLRYFSIHWKVFYFAAKHRITVVVVVLLLAIWKMLRSR